MVKNKKVAVHKIRKNRWKNKSAEEKQAVMKYGKLIFKSTLFGAFLIFLGSFFIFCHDMLTQWNYFSAKKITIEGNQKLSREEILDTAGIYEGINILALNMAVARKRLISHPWLKTIDIERHIPDKISITVTEYRPFAVVDIGCNFLINGEGELIKKAGIKETGNLPVVYGLVLSDIENHKKDHAGLYGKALDILKRGEDERSPLPNKKIKSIIVDRETGITVHTKTAFNVVKLGFGDFDKKYERMKQILLSSKKMKYVDSISSIDLYNPNRVVITPEIRT